MYYNNSDISSAAKVTDDVRSFCTIETCRREFICKHFGGAVEKNFQFCHQCCDNCEKTCNCDYCFCLEDINFDSDNEENSLSASNENDNKSNRVILCIQQALLDYFILENEATSMPMGSMNTGLTEEMAKDIAKTYKKCTKQAIMIKYSTVRSSVAENIVAIIEQCKSLF